jgi:hypothetical protein
METVYCQRCGSENVDDAIFCINCGGKIKRVDKEKEKKQERNEDTREQPKTLTSPHQSSSRPFFSNKAFIVVLIAIATISGFSIGMLVTNTFGEDGEKNGGPSDNTITFSVQDFYDALNYNIDTENYTFHSNINEVQNGDILKITGKIDRIVDNHDEDIGEYTSLALYCSNESNLLIHVLGNVTNEYNVGEYVITTLHLINCYGQYEDLYGTTWQLFGEFLVEEFIGGKFAFDLIVSQNQIKKI